MKPDTSHKLNPIKAHLINISLIIPILFLDNDNISNPKIIPTPIATPVRDMIGMPAAKYFMPKRIDNVDRSQE